LPIVRVSYFLLRRRMMNATKSKEQIMLVVAKDCFAPYTTHIHENTCYWN